MNLNELDILINHLIKTKDRQLIEFYLEKRKKLVNRIKVNVYNKLKHLEQINYQARFLCLLYKYMRIIKNIIKNNKMRAIKWNIKT